MTPEQIREEKLKKISAAIRAQLQNKTDSDDSLDEVKLNNMISAQMDALEEASKSRRQVEFEAGQDFRDDEIEESFKAINAMTPDSRQAHQQKMIRLSSKRLSRNLGNDLADSISEFKELSDEAYLVATMLNAAEVKKGASHRTFMDTYRSTEAYKNIHNRLKNDSDLRKALAVATAGSGAEWVPTGFSSNIETIIELELKVAAAFNSINMPTNPWKMPIQTTMGEGYYVTENTADVGTKHPASTPGTGNAEFVARKLAGRVLFSEEINEDAIVNMRGFTTQELGKMLARAKETAIINGDRSTAAGVAAAHFDNLGAAALFTSNNDARLAFDGLRYLALNNAVPPSVDFAAAVPSDTLLGSIRQAMGKFGVNPSDLVWLAPINTYLKMVMLTNARTVDKYGPQATVLSGELMKYDGIPVIVSEYAFSNLNASGVYDNTTTNLGQLLLAYRPGFLIGNRGGVTLNSEMDIETDQIKLVSKIRSDFVDHYDATLAANPMVGLGYNIKTT